MLKKVKVCSGGGFAYGGKTAEFKIGHGELIGLVEYDSKEGGAHGGLWGAGAGPLTFGKEYMRYWRGWKEVDGPIALAGRESQVEKRIGTKSVGKLAIGGFANQTSEGLSIGAYGGLGIGGVGGYAVLSRSGCK